jgi:hypothetical protein
MKIATTLIKAVMATLIQDLLLSSAIWESKLDKRIGSDIEAHGDVWAKLLLFFEELEPLSQKT